MNSISLSSVLSFKVVLVVLLAAASGSTGGLVYYYQGRTASLNSQVSILNDNANALDGQVNALRIQIANLTQQVSRLNQTALELQSLKTQLAATNAQLQSLETQLAAEISKLQSLEAQFNVQLASLQSQLTQSQALVAQLQALVAQLQAKVAGGLCSSGKTINIGELLDLTDGLSVQGVRAKDGSLIAISDINSFLSSVGCDLKFATTVDDYALDNLKALTDLQSLAASGVQVVVGPLNSGAAQFLLSYADANHIVLISPSSTSVALAIPNDYLFRTSPTDRLQALGDARMMVDRGATAVIIVQRHDSYGDALASATATRFQELTTSSGNKGVVIGTIPYDPTTTDFTTVLNTLQTDFNSNVATYGAGHIALDFVSFEEFGSMILKASSYPSYPWSTLPWFGTDGLAQDPVIVNPSTSGPLVAQVRLPSTLYAPVNNTKTFALLSKFAVAFPGNTCDSFCLGAYDDVWLAALATLEVGSYNGTRIQAGFLTVASSYYGVTGWLGLDANGDRATGSYQIWKVVNVGSPATPTWVLAGAWDSVTDTLKWTSPP